MSLEFRSLSGSAVAEVLEDLARLRLEVFRDWPYLYEGDLDYERRYLDHYRASAAAVVVTARDRDGHLVGAATGAPMEDHAEDFARPLSEAGLDPCEVFYCAESVLLPNWRGQGAGHRFFDLREDHARRLGRRYSVFCAVVRPADHPVRPTGYRPLDAFWRGRGYERMPGLFAQFSWRDIGEDIETKKALQLWSRAL